MGMKSCFEIVAFISLIFISMPIQAADIFGKIYDIDGDAKLKSAGGKEEKITRDRDLLRVVAEGDTIEVKGAGRVVIASYTNRKSYVIEADSSVTVRQNEIKTVKGNVSIRQKKVYVGEGAALGSPMLGTALRGAQPCVKAIAPVRTVLLTLTPELTWQNTCNGIGVVTIEVFREYDDEKVYSTVAEGGSFRIPEDILSYGVAYRWGVKSKRDYNPSLNTIRVPKEQKIREIDRSIADFKASMIELPDQLSFVHYLIEEGLSQDALSEIEKLLKVFPGNRHIEELANTVK